MNDGEVIDNILNTAKNYESDMIVMGTKEGFLNNNSMGSIINGVMRRTIVSVMVVHPVEQAK